MSAQNQVGLFTTRNDAPQDVANSGFSGALIHYGVANLAPLIAALNGKVTRNWGDTKVEWMEKRKQTGVNYIVSDQGDPLGYHFLFADNTWVTENTIFMVVSTGEVIMVNSINGNRVTVVRGFGGSQIMPIQPTAISDVVLQRIGTAFPEGSQRPIGSSTYHMTKLNFTQIFRNTWALTRTARMRQRKTDLKKRLKEETLMIHMRDIEMSMLFGIKSSGYQDGNPLRTMDGIYRQITTNIASPYNGILTKPALDYFLERIFEKTIEGQPNTRIAVCGRGFITLVNRLAEESRHYIMDGTEDFFGQDVTVWKTPHGTIKLIPHDLLSEIPGRRNDLIVLHPGAFHVYYMYEGQEDHEGVQGNQGVDADIGGLITEVTIALKGELTCGIMTGICDIQVQPKPVMITEPMAPIPNPGC